MDDKDLNYMANLVAFVNLFVAMRNLELNTANHKFQEELGNKMDKIIKLLEERKEEK